MDLFDRAGRLKVGYRALSGVRSLSLARELGEPLRIAAGFVQSVGDKNDHDDTYDTQNGRNLMIVMRTRPGEAS